MIRIAVVSSRHDPMDSPKLIGLRRHRLLFRRCHRWSVVMAAEKTRDMTDHRPVYGIVSAALRRHCHLKRSSSDVFGLRRSMKNDKPQHLPGAMKAGCWGRRSLMQE